MVRYHFSIQVFTHAGGYQDTPARPYGEVSGEVEAERYSQACTAAWPLILKQCKQIAAETGCNVSAGDLHVARADGMNG
jgi:hypothetical protein